MSDAKTMPVCYRHPDRPTYLSCSECGRPICPDCSHDAPVGQKCPECVRAAGKQRVVHARSITGGPSFQTSPVVFSLIAINVAIFVLGLTSSTVEIDLLNNFSAWTPAIEAGEWWRGLTAAFLHGGMMHILFNMYFLYIFGPRLEQQVGSVAFSGIYLASAAGGSVATFLFGPSNAISVGASGALFGLFGAWIYAAYRQRGSAAGSAMFNQLGGLLLINMALPLFIPNIDWRAHLGGLVTGIAVAFLWEQIAAGRANAKQMRVVISFAMMLAMLALLVVL
jgi:membrane associated rhomboid family serine protease